MKVPRLTLVRSRAKVLMRVEVGRQARVPVMAKLKAGARVPKMAKDGVGARVPITRKVKVGARVPTLTKNKGQSKSDKTDNKTTSYNKYPICSNQDQLADSSSEVFISILIYFYFLQT